MSVCVQSDDRAEGRGECYRCHRPVALCLCAHVPRIDNRTAVHILQHPRERFHPLGTSRFVSLGLERSRLEIAFGDGKRSVAHAMTLPPDTALLYPAPDAPFLEDLPAQEQPQHLLVLDGTWAQSRALYRQNPWLWALPHRQIRPWRPSRYRVRREPKAHFVSTLEAVVYALSVLEPETDLQPLLDAFERLMDDHLAQRQTSPGAPRCRRPRNKLSRAVPPVLLEEPERLAVLYVEPSLTEAAPGPRLPVQICALRLRDGARFERFVRPHGATPCGRHLAHMALTHHLFDGASAAASAVQALEVFLGDCVTVSWNATPAELLERAGARVRLHVSLKAAYCNLRKRHTGALEELLRDEGITPQALDFRGRAAQRMGNARALLGLLQREAARAQGPVRNDSPIIATPWASKSA